MKFIDAESYVKEKGYHSRKDRYKILEEYFGIYAGTIKDIISFDRYLRDIIEVDEVGLQKEKEWKRSPSQCLFDSESEKTSKRLQKDLERYA